MFAQTIQPVIFVKWGMEGGIQAQNASTVLDQANFYLKENASVYESVETFI